MCGPPLHSFGMIQYLVTNSTIPAIKECTNVCSGPAATFSAHPNPIALNQSMPSLLLPHLQKGDILLTVNGVSLLNKSHTEAIQLIKSAMGSPSVRLELIQGEGSKDPGGLSPDWEKWIKKYETAASSSGPQR